MESAGARMPSRRVVCRHSESIVHGRPLASPQKISDPERGLASSPSRGGKGMGFSRCNDLHPALQGAREQGSYAAEFFTVVKTAYRGLTERPLLPALHACPFGLPEASAIKKPPKTEAKRYQTEERAAKAAGIYFSNQPASLKILCAVSSSFVMYFLKASPLAKLSLRPLVCR